MKKSKILSIIFTMSLVSVTCMSCGTRRKHRHPTPSISQSETITDETLTNSNQEHGSGDTYIPFTSETQTEIQTIPPYTGSGFDTSSSEHTSIPETSTTKPNEFLSVDEYLKDERYNLEARYRAYLENYFKIPEVFSGKFHFEYINSSNQGQDDQGFEDMAVTFDLKKLTMSITMSTENEFVTESMWYESSCLTVYSKSTANPTPVVNRYAMNNREALDYIQNYEGLAQAYIIFLTLNDLDFLYGINENMKMIHDCIMQDSCPAYESGEINIINPSSFAIFYNGGFDDLEVPINQDTGIYSSRLTTDIKVKDYIASEYNHHSVSTMVQGAMTATQNVTINLESQLASTFSKPEM